MRQTNIDEIINIEHEGNVILYAVMRLKTSISIQNPLTQKYEDIKLANCAGYIPLFDNMEQARETAEDGKYEIIAIQGKH